LKRIKIKLVLHKFYKVIITNEVNMEGLSYKKAVQEKLSI
jgi:hypothetical protein